MIILRRAPKFGIDTADIENLLILTIPSGVVGARLLHVIYEWDFYKNNLDQIINIRGGGLAIHGAILTSAIVIYAYTRWKKNQMLPLADLAVPSLALGQAIGRFGNFFNQELYGSPTDLPWKVFIEPFNRLPGYYQYEYFHPTFLYESIFSLISFWILLKLSNKWINKSPGLTFSVYLIFYGAIRYFNEFFRIDEEAIFLSFKMAQLSSLVMIAIGVLIFYRQWHKNGR